MNLLLLNPTYHSRLTMGISYGEPLGLAYIAAMVERTGIDSVHILDSVGLCENFEWIDGQLRVGLPKEEIVSMITDFNPDLIGVSVISSNHVVETFEQISAIKKNHPHIPVVIGGAHASLEWQQCIENPDIDYIVIGEGEETIIELLDSLRCKRNLAGVKGLVFRDEKRSVIYTGQRPYCDVDTLPVPARHLLPMHNYFRYQPRHYYLRHPIVTIITSRGCPFRCVFCSTRLLWGNNYRGRNAVMVVDEIESTINDYGAREFLINDDCFLGNKKRVMEFCDEIIKRNIDISIQIPPGVNVHLLDENMLHALHKCGLYVIQPEFESGNPSTLKYIRKPVDLDYGIKMIRIANKIGMWTKTNLILGFPEETAEDIERTIKFAERLEVDGINFILPIPYRHTDMGRDYVSHGLWKDDGVSANYLCDSLHFTRDELERKRKEAQTRFELARMRHFLNPVYLFRFLNKLRKRERLALLLRRSWHEVKVRSGRFIFKIFLNRAI